jgi:hypothetical protein
MITHVVAEFYANKRSMDGCRQWRTWGRAKGAAALGAR